MIYNGLWCNLKAIIENKTELCLFYKKDCAPIAISLNGTIITSSVTMNVLGVIFDSKLQWTQHIAKAISKSNSALHAIRLISKYFTTRELLDLLTSNYYSILYYMRIQKNMETCIRLVQLPRQEI